MIRKLLLLLCLSFVATSAMAQEGFEQLSPYARGLGKTFSVSARGLEAVGLNPALLGLPSDTGLQIQVLPLSAYSLHAGPSFRDFSTINAIFDSSSTLSEDPSENRNRLLDYLRDGKTSGRVDARILGLSFYNDNIGGLALSWTTHIAVRTQLPGNFLNFLGDGAVAKISGQKLRASGFDVQAVGYNEIGLSYGKAFHLGGPGDFLGGLAIGGAVKYLMGIGYAGMDPGASLIINDPATNNNTVIQSHYRIRYSYPDFIDPQKINDAVGIRVITGASAGSGIGFDLGATVDLFPKRENATTVSPLRVSMSVCDIGAISWSSNTSARSSDDTSYIDHTRLGASDTLKKMLAPLAGRLDTTIGAFSTSLPTTFHLGASLDLESIGLSIPGTDFVVATEYAAGLTDAVGTPQHGRFGFGIGMKVPSKIISLRISGGYTMQDGIDDATLSIGTTIANSFNLDIATSNFGGLLQGTGTTDLVLAMSLMF